MTTKWEPVLAGITASTLLLALPGSVRAADSQARAVDLHCHAAGIGAGGSGCYVSDAMRNSWRYRIFLKAFGVSEEELMREGDRLVLKRLSEKLSESHSVAAAVVLALDGVVDAEGSLDLRKTEVYIPNEFIAKETAKYPNLLFGASINPYRKDAIKRLEQAARDGAVLVKWLPPIQEIDPSDPRLIPFYLKLKDLGLPLLSHTGLENSFTRANEKLGDPELLRLPLSLGVTVIAAHSACSGRSNGEANFARLLRLCREYPNLYADISSMTQFTRLGTLTQALNAPELRGRLLYGTDMPLINTTLVTPVPFLLSISPKHYLAIVGSSNPWDRDVALKRALGVGDDIFTNAALRGNARYSEAVARKLKSPQSIQATATGGNVCCAK